MVNVKLNSDSPGNSLFVSKNTELAKKLRNLVQACKKLFYQTLIFLNSFHKNGPIKKSPRVITDIIILELHTRGFLIFFNFVGAIQVLVFLPTFLDQSVEHLLAWHVNLSHTNVNLLNTKMLYRRSVQQNYISNIKLFDRLTLVLFDRFSGKIFQQIDMCDRFTP